MISSETKWFSRAVVAAAALPGLVGLLVLTGWHLHSNPLIQLQPHFIAMTYNAAVAFVASSLCLLATFQGRRKLGLSMAAFVTAVGCLYCVEYLFQIDFGLDELFVKAWNTVATPKPGRMAPNTAFCFVMTGLALFAAAGSRYARTRDFSLGMLGGLLLALGCIPLLGYFVGMQAAYTWVRGVNQMAVHTSAMFVSLGFAFISISWLKARAAGDRIPNWLPWLVGISALAGTLLVSQALFSDRQERLYRLFSSSHQIAELTVKRSLQTHSGALQRFQRVWEDNPTLVRQEWERGSLQWLTGPEMGGMRALCLVDPRDQIWSAAKEAVDCNALIEASQALASALPELFHVGKTVAIRLPKNHLGKVLIGVFQLREALDVQLRESATQDFGFSLTDQERVLFSRHLNDSRYLSRFGVSGPLRILGAEWKLTLWPTNAVLQADSSPIPAIAFGTGLFISVLMVLATYFARASRIRAWQAEESERARHGISERMNLALAAAHVSTWIWDLPRGLIRWDEFAPPLFHLTADELPSTVGGLLETLEREDRDALEQAIRVACLGNEFNAQLPLRSREGVSRTLQLRGEVFAAAEDRPLCLRGVIWDITAQTQAEYQLRRAHELLEQKVAARTAALAAANQKIRSENEQRIQALEELNASNRRSLFMADSMPQIVWTATPDGSIDYYSQRWYDYTGMTFAQTKDWGWDAVLHPDDLEGCIRAWKESLATGEPYEMLHRFKGGSDGVYRWHLGRAIPMRDENGNVVQWFGTSTDIDDQKQAETALRRAGEMLEARVIERTAALRDQKEQFRITLETANDAFCCIDSAGSILEWNRQAEKTFGWRKDEVMGRLVSSLLPLDISTLTETGARSILNQPVELTAMRCDGQNIQVETTVWSVRSQGELRFNAFLRDITARKQMEEALRHQNAELEDQNRRIDQANRMKSAFLANMSHELRTPLNGIIGFSELIADGLAGDVTPQQQDFLADILNSSRHLLGLINDVLDLAKVESGTVVFRPEKVWLRKLVHEAISGLRQLALQKQIHLQAEIGNGPEEVILDPQKFKQVLLNYTSNALKFTPYGGRVTVRIQHEADRAVRLEVEDNGIGVAREDLPRLFQDFQQVNTGSNKQYQGTGLGLALTRRLVEAQGGSVGVVSAPGEGSTFSALLPLSRHSF